MKRTKFKIEYQLKTSSINILWNSIGTPLGLAEWFADGVTVNNEEYVFSWDKNEQTAFLIDNKTNTSIRFQWEEDKNTDVYFQLEIVTLDLSNHVGLVITDFTTADDKEDAILLWNSQVETLCRIGGM